MTRDEIDQAARKALAELIESLSDRAGIGDEYNILDTDTKREIEGEWLEIFNRFAVKMVNAALNETAGVYQDASAAIRGMRIE